MTVFSGRSDVRRDNRYRVIGGLALACLVFDQLTKAAVTAWIPLHQGVAVIPGFFDLVHVLNRGAAFGFLNRADIDWQFWLFLLATLLAAGMVLNLARASGYDRTLFCGLGLILGGAAGNLVDRVRLRAVVDFMDVYVGSWHWPAFNVADVAICLGALLTGLTLWRRSSAARRAAGNGEA